MDRAGTLKDLVEASPEAILVLGSDGLVTQANERTTELLGDDLVGRPLADVVELPTPATTVAVGARFQVLGLEGTAAGGGELLLDVVTAPLRSGDDVLVAVFLRDAQERLEGERLAALLRESEVRRVRALELNDAVVQGLTAVGHVLALGDTERAKLLMNQTLVSARRLIDEWLTPLEGELAPGDLVRSGPSSTGDREPATGPGTAPARTPGRTRVLVVDDDQELRELFVMQLQADAELEVVGQAADGDEAVRLAGELAPDVVLLDVAMPVMDGLQALPLILRRSPTSRVVVVSAFDQEGLGDQALALGAVDYVEKGLTMRLPDVVRAALVA